MSSKQTALAETKQFRSTSWNVWLFLAVLTPFTIILLFWHDNLHSVFSYWPEWNASTEKLGPLVRSYHLETGVRWINPDGGRWRVMFTCNGQTPCSILYAKEGDIVKLSVKSDIYTQSSIHLSGIGHKQTVGPWNDGTAGLSQGLAGALYVAPSPDRPRPYHLITNDTLELRQINQAEREIQHLIIQSHQHHDTVWKLLRMRAEGSEYYCYNYILVNVKGRVHAVNQSMITSTGRNLIKMAAFNHQVCQMKAARRARQTMRSSKPKAGVRLDAEPGDYAIRISSTSVLQNLHCYAVLRYPAKRLPQYGEPMALPPVAPGLICVLPDGSTQPNCSTAEGQLLPPYPPQPPPSAGKHYAGMADFTFRLAAGSQASKTEKYVPEYFLNEKPWQLYHGSMLPLLFHAPNETLVKPIIGNLPLCYIIDLIIENQINETIPLYKHGDPSWFLGSGGQQRFPGNTVQDAIDSDSKSLNLQDPALVIVHDLPALGWSVLRFKVTSQQATIIHAAKLRYFALGMSVPILEGITEETPIKIPESVVNRPHVEFKPAHDGIFG
ncbi:Laccase abr2 [Fusarium oxysporum f. sp. rapae]|uniref:Laccase abr2 n=1 Tax=Fusarium oxysporum f. sp. rapae TaxID=485398 RepID=A0A8J5NGX6_FUSOX|nr:Laccase abr2 [Fusarium oxysporum f. sp. rapae]